MPIDMDEYLVAPGNSSARSIQAIFQPGFSPRTSGIIVRRVDYDCSSCRLSREVDSWPTRLGPDESPLRLYDRASFSTYCRLKSIVNPNCYMGYTVHEGVVDRHTRGCETRAPLLHRCAYLVHMRSMFAKREDGFNWTRTDEVQGFAAYMTQRIQALGWREALQ